MKYTELDKYKKAIELGLKKDKKVYLRDLINSIRKSAYSDQIIEDILKEELIEDNILIGQHYDGKVINFILFNECILPFLIDKINLYQNELYFEQLYYLFGLQESSDILYSTINGLKKFENEYRLKGFVEFTLNKFPENIKFNQWYNTILNNEDIQ